MTGLAQERIELAKDALVGAGYFTADEVGDDIAPRITEMVSAIREGKWNPRRRSLDVEHPGVGYLTPDEHEAVSLLADVTNTMARVIGKGRTPREAVVANNDITEAVHHIHALQNMVLAQAAARAYPKTYRLMGQSLRKDDDDD